MHYPKVAFPIVPGTVTIVPKEAGVTIGQRADMSPSDVLEVKRVYKCPGELLWSENTGAQSAIWKFSN